IIVDPTGTLRESVSYDNPLTDSPSCMLIANGKVHIGGYISPSTTEKDQLLLRYSYMVATENAIGGSESSIQLFPNPCTNYFTIENDAFAENIVKSIELCDLLGRKTPIHTLQSGAKITIEMPNDLPNGTYILSSQERRFAPVKVVKMD
ncbi:MAG: Secretion system C-terminal sorting domain, partial [Bacteroidota bacterium]